MKEARAYDRLTRYWPQAHWQRIEGWATVGVFDSNACLRGQEVWVENKEAERPKRKDTLIKAKKVRPSQIAWEYLRRRAGGRLFIALLVEDDLYILKGEYLRTIRDGVTSAWLAENNLGPQAIFDFTEKQK